MSTFAPPVTLVGQTFWASRLADLVATYAPDLVRLSVVRSPADIWQVRHAALVVRVGFRPGAPTWRGMLFDALWSGLVRRPRHAYYWIGTDVFNAQADARRSAHTRWFDREACGAEHWAGAQWLTDELIELGVPARCVLFPAALPPPVPVMDLPGQFRVLSYLPDSRWEFYGGKELLAAAAELPDVQFSFFGGTGSWAAGRSSRNVTFLGWLTDVTPAYLASSVVVRMVPHDALGGSVREALALGRHVLYTYPVQHTERIVYRDLDELIRRVRELGLRHSTGNLPPNLAGMHYARAAFDPGRLARELAIRLRDAAA